MKLEFYPIYLLVCTILILVESKEPRKLNIALHAQVYPSPDKIVGSVITTDGLYSAFIKRSDVKHVEIFYPFNYGKLFSKLWDIIIIEGWFLMLNEFIALSRNHNPNTIIIYYCLDPSFPDISYTYNLDVDGFMTNSEILRIELSKYAPTIFLMLAADEEKMVPLPNVTREFGAVYIGAGGQMLDYKSSLLPLLESALPYGLRLHGTNWNLVPSLAHVWRGVLPRDEIQHAYASAEVVLASTINSQKEYGMINNRIFEALACGSIVATEYMKEIETEFKDLVILLDKPEEVGEFVINFIKQNPEYSNNLRSKAREMILARHTWSHRVIEIINFYGILKSKLVDSVTEKVHSRNNFPKLAWIVSDHLIDHPDYIFSIKLSLLHFKALYDIEYINQTSWLTNYKNSSWLAQYEILIAVLSLYDEVDKSFQSLEYVNVANKNKIQRKGCFIVGYKNDFSYSDKLGTYLLLHYDVIWVRSYYEWEVLERNLGLKLSSLRVQHSFGVGTEIDTQIEGILSENQIELSSEDETKSSSSSSSSPSAPSNYHPLDVRYQPPPIKFKTEAILCFFIHINTCVYARRKNFGDNRTMLILLGGKLDSWLSNPLFLGETPLSNIILSTEGSTSTVLSFIETCDTLYIMHPKTQKNNETIATDIIWPILFAGRNGIKIQLYESNNHLLEVGNYLEWDYRYKLSSVRVGLARMLSLGVSQSEVEILFPISDTIVIYPVFHLNLNVLYFEAGKDGQTCIIVDNREPLCLIRSTVQIYLSADAGVNRNQKINKNVIIKVELRGNVFQDVIFTTKTEFQLDIQAFDIDELEKQKTLLLKENKGDEIIFITI